MPRNFGKMVKALSDKGKKALLGPALKHTEFKTVTEVLNKELKAKQKAVLPKTRRGGSMNDVRIGIAGLEAVLAADRLRGKPPVFMFGARVPVPYPYDTLWGDVPQPARRPMKPKLTSGHARSKKERQARKAKHASKIRNR